METSDQLTPQEELAEIQKLLDAYRPLLQSDGWEQLVDDAEDRIAQVLNRVLNPEPGLEGIVGLLMNLGEIRGIKRISEFPVIKVEESVERREEISAILRREEEDTK